MQTVRRQHFMHITDIKVKKYHTLPGPLAVLLAVAAGTTAIAQTTPQARIVARPLSSDDIAAYKLPSTTSHSAGLFTVALGEPAYLEVQLDIKVAASDIVSTDWLLTTKPSGSAAFLTDSPLGTNVPIFEPSDRLVFQVTGRKLLRPDVAGMYVVTATVTTHSGTINLAQTIIAATYVGINTCTICHSGGLADVKVPAWSKTLHAEIFKDNINGVATPGETNYPSTCWGCHTVGYDPAKTTPNGGFDDVMKQLGWTPPAVTKAGNWDAVPDALKNVANIQCENCHGPGSLHAASGGDPIAISVSTDSGDCNQCHGAAPHHVKGAEWNNSMHAVTTTDPAGSPSCVGCHTGTGFIQRADAAKAGTAFVPVDTSYKPINCQTCHEPHGQTVPDKAAHQIRMLLPVTLADGTTVKQGGNGLLCMNCHHARMKAADVPTTQGTKYFGPHHGPQTDMLEGVNGFTYGKNIPSSAHEDVVPDTCVTCHMQAVASNDPALTFVGGHTFKPHMDATGKLPAKDLVGACQNCHGPDLTSFDFPLFDYNDDGVVEGVQTEVQHLLDQLSTLLPPDNKVKTSLSIDSTWTPRQLEGAYNWLFVNNDGSHGIHNTAYAVGLLKASIADLSGTTPTK